MTEHKSPLTWEVRFSLISNPNIVKAWLKAMGLTYVVCMVILVPIFIATGEYSQVPIIMMIFAGGVLGLSLLGFVIMAVLMGNHSYARFTLTDKKIIYENMDKKTRALSRIAVVAGGLLGSGTTAGAGLLSISNEAMGFHWTSVAKAVYDPKHYTICLRNTYRELLHLYCTKEIYDQVQDRVQTILSRNQSKEAEKSTAGSGQDDPVSSYGSPLPGALKHSLFVMAASMPLYALCEVTRLDLLIPIITMTFSMAMIWLIPLFGWVVLIMEGYIVFQTTSALLLVRELKLTTTYRYHKYELLDSGEWAVIVLSVAGMIYLAWISIGSLNGKMVPVLMRDQE